MWGGGSGKVVVVFIYAPTFVALVTSLFVGHLMGVLFMDVLSLYCAVLLSEVSC